MATSLAKPEASNGKAIVQVGKYSLSTIIENELWKSDELAKVANVLFPATALDALPPMHRPSLSVIRVDTDKAKKEVYPTNAGQLALSKATILKMLNASGASVKTEKLTPDSDLDNIRWTAWVWGKLPDGTQHMSQGSKSYSWIKCQEQMSADQAKKYREFADEQTETKAILRAARAFINLKTSYSPAELQKPFLIARSIFSPDMSDPEIRRMYAEKMIEATQSIYGTGPTKIPPSLPMPPGEPDDAEFADEDDAPTSASVSEAATESEPMIDSDPFEDPPATPAPAGPPACGGCGQPIEPIKIQKPDGSIKEYTASEIVDLTSDKADDDVPRCYKCFEAYVAARKGGPQ